MVCATSPKRKYDQTCFHTQNLKFTLFLYIVLHKWLFKKLLMGIK